MINAHVPHAVGSRRAAAVYRISYSAYGALFALVCLLVVGVALVLIQSLPERTPLARAGDVERVREAVLLQTSSATDPLIEVRPGELGRSSSVRGFELQGQVYYYYFEGRKGYDPLSRGAVGADQVELLLRDASGAQPLVIYRVLE